MIGDYLNREPGAIPATTEVRKATSFVPALLPDGGSRLLFTMDDVATLALAYWLFRSGLRMLAIKQALDASNVKRFWKHLDSVERFEEVGTNLEFLVTWRSAKGRDALQEVRLENDFADVQQILRSVPEYGFVVIPIGRLLKELAGAIQKY